MVYLDNAATTKPSEKAIKNAEKYLYEEFYNPSALYRGGLSVAKSVNEAKASILKNLGLSPAEYEVVFTSCGTESDNQAIFCMEKRGVFVTDAGEHAAVNKCFEELARQKKEVVFVPIDDRGGVNFSELKRIVKESKANFVSIMHVNNETGAINDVSRIADELKKIDGNVIFHSDGVQAYGKIPFVFSKNIDAYSISAHKIGGLKGVGALIKKRKLNLSPYIFGGGQENGLRSGTENTFGINVFRFAGEEKYAEIDDNYKKIRDLNDYLRQNLDKDYFKIISGETASPYILSASAVGLKGEVIMHALEEKGFIVGNGSACSARNRFSRVIKACGYDEKTLDGVLRISFSSESTISETMAFTQAVNDCVKNLKGIMGK